MIPQFQIFIKFFSNYNKAYNQMDINGEPGEIINLASGGEVFCVLESAHPFFGLLSPGVRLTEDCIPTR